ncbi:hypothetical protein FFWV33_11900 [Flavobacterium faecale]|uniref:Uncharacterized protein n=1 Tax=Flavobacterium faecale TaxID=1355330 RepID=A0A2S1LEH0_9FLAO|nr:hypothetical protein FFWV33_11900 [Flavobacterium faecale]
MLKKKLFNEFTVLSIKVLLKWNEKNDNYQIYKDLGVCFSDLIFFDFFLNKIKRCNFIICIQYSK